MTQYDWKKPPACVEEPGSWWCKVRLSQGEQVSIVVTKLNGGWIAAFRKSDLAHWGYMRSDSQTGTGRNREAAADLLLKKLERARPRDKSTPTRQAAACG